MRNEKNRQILRIALAVLSVFAWVAIPFVIQDKVEAGGGVVILVRTANLASPTGSVNPHGEAEYQLYQGGQRELEIEIEDVNLADGTVLSFFVDNLRVGEAALSGQRVKLKLRSESGQNIPVTNDGSLVVVRNAGTTLVAGILGGGGPNPGASPTASPSGSPNASPSPSPSGSPNPSPSASPASSPSPSPSASPNGGNLFARLTGGTVNGVLPNGYAEFEIHSSRLELEVRLNQLNLPAGTQVNILVNGVSVGQIFVQNGEGRLRLRSDNGQIVPNVTAGSTIAIQNGGATVLSGVFTGFTGASPSPSPNPTASPGASPSPSPTPSPALGRFFEAHPTGSQVSPPVSTSANGEFKVILNSAETQATFTAEFHNLSSSQTGARIETEVGTNPVVVDFGAIGGRNGNLPTKTVAVTGAQVQQLRSGLWFAVVTSANFPSGEIRGRLTHHSNSADFDGDGGTDLAVYRPSATLWLIKNSAGFTAQTLGTQGQVVSGDYDGDGRTDTALFRDLSGRGFWMILRSSDRGITNIQFGLSSDIPVRGDYDGDGRSDLAVYRPSTGSWYILRSSDGSFFGAQFGAAEDKPVAGDYDGDGKHDIAVYRPSAGDWYILRSSDGAFQAARFGAAEDKPLVADFDGDGRADYAVFRPSVGHWYVLRSSDNSFFGIAFGFGSDVPVPGNYDSDDKSDVAVFRPSDGYWYVLRSSDGAFQATQWGTNGDIPVVAP